MMMYGQQDASMSALRDRFPDVESIVTSGLCMGCGLCVSLIGDDKLEMKLTSGRRLCPASRTMLDASEMEQVRSVCPGINVTGPDASTAGPDGVMHPIWGPVRSLQLGWSGNPETRFWAAAGGSMTALGCQLLQSGEVDAVLHVRASESDPTLTDSLVSTSVDEVISGAQSRYGPGAPLVHVHRLLDSGKRFAVLAKPCDVAAIRNLAKIDHRVDTQIPYLITIFCGGLPSQNTALDIAGHHGVEHKEIGTFRFRGNGWPGPTHVRTNAGDVHEISYDYAWYTADVPWTYDMSFRCKLCPDAIGELSDVSCPDGWVMRDGKPIHEEAPGMNVVIARTARGERLVKEAVASGQLSVAPFSMPELDPMHGDHHPRKLENPARVLGMGLAGEPRPQFRNFRLGWTLLHAGLLRQIRALLGTWRRVRQGRNREPVG